MPLLDGVRLIDIPHEAQGNRSTAKIIALTDTKADGTTVVRPVIVANIDGVNVPFYISSGDGGKAGVATGKWYPFAGIGQDGWFNKGTDAQMTACYGSERLRAVADYLNKTYGDVSGASDLPRIPTREAGKRVDGPHVKAINADIRMPAGSPDVNAVSMAFVYENLLGIFHRIGDDEATRTTESYAESLNSKYNASDNQNDDPPQASSAPSIEENGGLSIFDVPEDGDIPQSAPWAADDSSPFDAPAAPAERSALDFDEDDATPFDAPGPFDDAAPPVPQEPDDNALEADLRVRRQNPGAVAENPEPWDDDEAPAIARPQGSSTIVPSEDPVFDDAGGANPETVIHPSVSDPDNALAHDWQQIHGRRHREPDTSTNLDGEGIDAPGAESPTFGPAHVLWDEFGPSTPQGQAMSTEYNRRAEGFAPESAGPKPDPQKTPPPAASKSHPKP